MAKTKAPKELKAEIHGIDKFKDIKKTYGNIMQGLDFVLDKEQKIISIGPALDWGCGGIEVGSWNVLAGPPKSGKTTTVMQIASNAQKQYGMHVFYCNVEARFKKQNTEGLALDPNLFTLITSTEEKILSAEDYLNVVDNILKSESNAFVVIDSLSSLCSEAEMTEGVRGNGRLINPRILGNFCRKCASIVPIRSSVLMGINHMITNTSGHGGKHFQVDGGLKVQYQADTILHVKYFQDWTESDEVVGQQVHWNIVNTGLGKRGKEVTSYLRYGTGIDRVMEIFQLGVEFAAIEQAGSWFNITALHSSEEECVKKYITDNSADKPEDIEKLFKFQGAAKCCQFLTENPAFIDVVYNYIKAMT